VAAALVVLLISRTRCPVHGRSQSSD
ncbi:uncharacterized protein METZ01_LOCUS434513, partial [marine metagenome]